MGKRIIQRARGKGGPRYRSPGHRFVSKLNYGFERGEVIDIVHDPARNAPLAKIKAGDKEFFIIAAEGLKVGDMIDTNGEAKAGNILQLNKVPKGQTVFAIENQPGSGPKLCCSPGTKALIVSVDENNVLVQMPSKEFKKFRSDCLATVGIPAGSGRKEKPFVKAGQNAYAKSARNKLWPVVSGVKMNAVDHPFGGRTKPGIPKTISRNAPPGAKVGSIAASRTGKRKRK